MKTVLIVQCRLSSHRLARKALLPLGGMTVLDWTLRAMRRVPADGYYVATDEASATELRPIVEQNSFSLFVGPLEDVLERFCLLIEETNADAVIRATADNPFLFYEAAEALSVEYARRKETGTCDYITWTGLPHGSGVELFDAHSLLQARALTSLPYDHEHVGPALYNHSERFTSIMLPAPREWCFPNLRTTIDTAADYRRAQAVVREVERALSVEGARGTELGSDSTACAPYDAAHIIAACSVHDLLFPVLCVPCVKKGRGTGHLRRALSIAVALGADVYLPNDADLDKGRMDGLISAAKADGLSDWQLTSRLPEAGDYALIVTDAFSLNRELALRLSAAAPLVAIDEGSLNTDVCDYLLDIIPSCGQERAANLADPSFVTLPEKRRTEMRPATLSDIRSVLVTVGGEDPADLVIPAAVAFARAATAVGSPLRVTAIVPDTAEAAGRLSDDLADVITLIAPVHNLRERLYEYDVVVTHYGFTAFEAVAAGCGVMLLGTTPLHAQLAQKHGFVCIASSDINEAGVRVVLSNIAALYPESPFSRRGAGQRDLGAFIRTLARGSRYPCPICGERGSTAHVADAVVSRVPARTFRRCAECGLLYMSWTADTDEKLYDEAYFFDSYRRQYGKTYLDDFSAIKSQCVRRTSIIDQLYRAAHKAITPTVLDIGCAFGPYLDAASDAGWQVFGTDVSEEAVRYVQDTLHYPAAHARFPAFDPAAAFGVRQFDAVTMWFVIEHFQNLDAVLRGVSRVLKTGGIFAFSTPSASGVSARFSPQRFFQQSPSDHFSLWEPARAASLLRRYGFKVVKMVYTGHHPERFPKFSRRQGPSSFRFSLFSAVSHFFGLGDTFEVYCRKEREVTAGGAHE